MLSPAYWADRLAAPDTPILDREAIARLNRAIHRRGNRVRPLLEHESIRGGRIRRILEDQLEGLTHWKKYDRKDRRMRDPGFLNMMTALVRPDLVPDQLRVSYGLTVRRSRVRLMPTDMPVRRRPGEPEFDILQASVLDAGQPVALYYRSPDGEWGAVQTPICFGWIRIADCAWSSEKGEIVRYLNHGTSLVALSNSVTVYADPACRAPLTFMSMGGRLPFDGVTGGANAVLIPDSLDDRIGFSRAFVGYGPDVRVGFPELTGRNILLMAFRQLGEPYGWGGTGVGTDCSQFIMNTFGVFGLDLPRTSFLQIENLAARRVPAKMKARLELLGSLPPARTMLQFPGHIGLYLGRSGGRHYMIHSLSAYRVGKGAEEEEIRVDRVIVSDLSLGEGSSKGSLLERLVRVSVLR